MTAYESWVAVQWRKNPQLFFREYLTVTWESEFYTYRKTRGKQRQLHRRRAYAAALRWAESCRRKYEVKQ